MTNCYLFVLKKIEFFIIIIEYITYFNNPPITPVALSFKDDPLEVELSFPDDDDDDRLLPVP